MCTVSNIGDNYRDNFAPRWPGMVHPNTWPAQPTGVPYPAHPSTAPVPVFTPAVSKQEFEALKKEVEELKQLLKAAKKFDEETGQPDCHMDDKVDFIKKLAEYVGVDLEDIFKK